MLHFGMLKDLFVNLSFDLVAILILAGLLYYRRHKRRDLFVTFTFFNIAMFVIVSVIAHTSLGLGASFGLFALLGIIRLRSEEFTNYEIGYFFGCLTLAIINGIGIKDHAFVLSLNFLILLSIGILDHPKIMQDVRHSHIMLDSVYDDDAKIKITLEKLLNSKVLSFNILKIDIVRDITSLNVQYKKLNNRNGVEKRIKY